MKKIFNIKTKTVSNSAEDAKEFDDMFKSLKETFNDFVKIDTIEQNGLTVNVKDGIISIKGSPKSITLEGKEIFKPEEEDAKDSEKG